VHFVIRAAIDAGQLAQAVRRAAAAADPSVPVEEFRTQTALIDNLLRTERLLSVLSSAFGAVALTLAAVGLAGLLAYTVARRRNEIGIRMALGAAPGDVVRMVLSDSLWLVAIGVLAGLPGAYAIGRALESTLFGLEPADPLTAAAALAVLAMVAALAAWLPARRAARVDPMAALRDE
jgi:ABC-type antimicrobial peptide transport system permease subunit